MKKYKIVLLILLAFQTSLAGILFMIYNSLLDILVGLSATVSPNTVDA